jgi:hypothetical protein
MKRLIQLNLLLLLISTAAAQDSQPQQSPPQESQKVLRDYDWKNLAQQQTLPGEVISTNGSSILKIEITNDTPQDFLLLKISDPAVIKKAYFLLCEAKRENVSVTNNYDYVSFADRMNHPTSLSLGVECSLPPAVLGGDRRMIYAKAIGIGRNFIFGRWTSLQFELVRDSLEGLPTQLEVHLFTRGSEVVYLRPIRLWGVAASWWSPQQIGLIGGIGGSVIGCFGALLGLLASKGKARTFVLTTMKIFIALGILLTIAGFVAVVSSQPYAVWYALLLPGVILTLVFSLTLPSIQRRYDELEIRRMTSVDAMGS